MPVRGIYRGATPKGVAHTANAPIYVDSDGSDIVKIIPAGSGSTEVQLIDASSTQTLTNKTLTTPVIASSTNVPYIQDATGGALIKMAAGSGAFVTGTVIVATGLATVVGFSASLSGTGTRASGATEISIINVSSITTGAVSLVGSYNGATGATIISASGANGFRWIAYGT